MDQVGRAPFQFFKMVGINIDSYYPPPTGISGMSVQLLCTCPHTDQGCTRGICPGNWSASPVDFGMSLQQRFFCKLSQRSKLDWWMNRTFLPSHRACVHLRDKKQTLGSEHKCLHKQYRSINQIQSLAPHFHQP